MPRLDTYISQGSIAPTTGQPEAPLSLGSQQGLIGAAERLSDAFTQLTTTNARLEHAQMVSEQTTAGSNLLLDLDQQTQALASEHSVPGHAIPPAARKSYFSHLVAKLGEDTLKTAAEKGSVAQQYVAQHLRTVVDPHIKTFSTHMDTLRREEGQFDFMTSTKALIDRAATLPPDEQRGVAMDLIQRGSVAVQAGFMSGEQAMTFINTEGKRLALETARTKISADPAGFLENPPPNTPSDHMEYARNLLALRHGEATQQRQEGERVKKETEDANLLIGEEMILTGVMNNEDQLRKFTIDNGHLLSPEGLTKLQHALKNHIENHPSDPALLHRLYTQMESFDSTKWPTDGEITGYMVSGRLNRNDALPASTHLRAIKDEYRKEGNTRYRDEVSQAEKQVDDYFKPLVGGLLDYDKNAGIARADALRSVREHGLKMKDKPEGAYPMGWVDEIVNPHIVALAQKDRLLITSDLIRMGLGPNLNSIEKVEAAFQKGDITPKQLEFAVQRLRLVDTLDQIEKVKKAPSSTTDTIGVERNR